jgi:hypothetical protein
MSVSATALIVAITLGAHVENPRATSVTFRPNDARAGPHPAGIQDTAQILLVGL